MVLPIICYARSPPKRLTATLCMGLQEGKLLNVKRTWEAEGIQVGIGTPQQSKLYDEGQHAPGKGFQRDAVHVGWLLVLHLSKLRVYG